MGECLDNMKTRRRLPPSLNCDKFQKTELSYGLEWYFWRKKAPLRLRDMKNCGTITTRHMSIMY